MGETNNFDPKWPHGHVTTDGRKVKLLPHVGFTAQTEDGSFWQIGPFGHAENDDNYLVIGFPNVINAPPPKAAS